MSSLFGSFFSLLFGTKLRIVRSTWFALMLGAALTLWRWSQSFFDVVFDAWVDATQTFEEFRPLFEAANYFMPFGEVLVMVAAYFGVWRVALVTVKLINWVIPG